MNVSWAANQHIKMISDGLCGTEDWSNDAENSALHHFLYIFTAVAAAGLSKRGSSFSAYIIKNCPFIYT